MAYNKTVWENNHSPKINATNLNNIEDGIEMVDTNIGDLSDLNTTETGSVVGAINEVNDSVGDINDFFTLSNSITYSGNDMTSSNGTVQNYSSVTIKYNDAGTLAEISGTIYNNHSTSGSANITLAGTPLRPTSETVINKCVSFYNNTVIGESVTVATNGTITFNLYGTAGNNSRHTVVQTLNILA